LPQRVVPARLYLVVCLALVVLTGLTIGVAHVNLGGWNSPLAMAIAGLKALLIGLFFMHLRWSPSVTRLVVLAAVFWLGLLLVGTMDDFVTRGWLPIPGK
jgi:cytochrome c oxidase subunit IV